MVSEAGQLDFDGRVINGELGYLREQKTWKRYFIQIKMQFSIQSEEVDKKYQSYISLQLF